ncbi:MAG: hypothetical protein JO170_14680, partial [Verrucomicrobia bacterium]|nr:hypothetical protein [Verrucomicrobiota bacterium]
MASPSRWKTVLLGGLIVAVGLWVYWPAVHGDWLWDDNMLIRDNTRLRSFHGLYEIWFSASETDYWPLSWTLLWLEWHLWDDQTVGYHLASLGLHLISAFLIWRLLSKLGLRWGWVGGLLFVLHPLAVESVAWMSEIKNTLSLPLFLLSLEALIETDETNSPWAYGRSFLLYLAAMLAKTSVIALPFVFLLYCWWKRARIAWSDFRKIIPFLILAVILGLITLGLQHIHTPDTLADLAINSRGPLTRLMGAGMAIFFYLGKFIWPVELLPIYPRWPIDSLSLLEFATIPLLALLFFGCWTQRHRWGRHALLGLGFFVLTLLPVLGFFKMSYLSISWVADHLAYLSLVGLIGLAVAGMERAYRLLSVRKDRTDTTIRYGK